MVLPVWQKRGKNRLRRVRYTKHTVNFKHNSKSFYCWGRKHFYFQFHHIWLCDSTLILRYQSRPLINTRLLYLLLLWRKLNERCKRRKEIMQWGQQYSPINLQNVRNLGPIIIFTVSEEDTIQSNKIKTPLTSVVTVTKQKVSGRVETERLIMFNVQGWY
jgi:hypothetical protein